MCLFLWNYIFTSFAGWQPKSKKTVFSGFHLCLRTSVRWIQPEQHYLWCVLREDQFLPGLLPRCLLWNVSFSVSNGLHLPSLLGRAVVGGG